VTNGVKVVSSGGLSRKPEPLRQDFDRLLIAQSFERFQEIEKRAFFFGYPLKFSGVVDYRLDLPPVPHYVLRLHQVAQPYRGQPVELEVKKSIPVARPPFPLMLTCKVYFIPVNA